MVESMTDDRMAGPSPGSHASVSHPQDQLLAAILRLSLRLGRACHPQSVVAGIALDQDRIPLEHLDRALANAGLEALESQQGTAGIGLEHIPALVIAADGTVWVIDNMVAPDGPGKPGLAGYWAAATGDITLQPLGDAAFRHCTVMTIRHGQAQPGHDVAPASERDDAHLRRIGSGNRPLYLQAAAITIALNLLGLALPLFTMNVYDRVLPNFAFDTLTALSVGAVLAITFELAMRVLRASVIDTASSRTDVAQATHLFSHVLGARLTGKSAAVGLRAGMLREFETLREFRSSLTVTTLGDVPFFVVYIAMIAWIAGPLAIVALCTLPFVFGAAMLFNRRQARLAREGLGQVASRNAVAVETLAGMETLKAIGAEGWAAGRWETAVAAQLRTSNQMRFYASLGINLVNLVQSCATVLVVVVGVNLVARGSISAGALMATMMLLARAMAPVAQMALLFNRIHAAQAARQAIDSFLDAPQERSAASAFVTPPVITGAVKFEKVGFSYDPQSLPVLQDLSLEIAAGERVGLIGAIGTGKSTLMKLMLHLHQPTAGRIRLDDVGLSAMDPALVRHAIGHVGQDSTLFSGTIRTNLSLHRPHATDEMVIEAARMATALDWISRLPRGFDTQIGERGAGLSGGQRQSLLIARALIGAPALLLLDEPSSDLDSLSERQLITNLEPFCAGRTIVIASHRPAMLDLVERLVVLENGRIFADGPKAKVLAILKAEHARRLSPSQRGDAA